MRKAIVLIMCFLCLTGCSKKDNNVENNLDSHSQDTEFKLKKIDEEKDFVVVNENQRILVNNEEYVLNTLQINLNSEEVANVNLEIKTFVNNSIKKFVLNGNELQQGNIINYDYYVSQDYISIIQRYHLYYDGLIGEEKDNVYVVSLHTGKVVNSLELLSNYNLDEDAFYKLLEEKIDSEDKLFTLLNIKNHGYSLYVNNENKLCVIYREITDDSNIKKELSLT